MAISLAKDIHPMRAASIRIGAIAVNTFREALRNRAFIALVLTACVFLAFSWILSEMAVPGQGSRVIMTFGFFAISLFCVITAIVMGAVLLHKELEKKTITTILSKPVHRYEFLLGKYLGMLAILAVELVGLSLVWMAVYGMRGGDAFAVMLTGAGLMYLEVMLVTAVAVMFSALSSPVLTALFTTGVFFVGRVHTVIVEMLGAQRGILVDNPWAGGVAEAVVAIFPDLSVFNVSEQAIWGVEVGFDYWGNGLLYAGGYIVIGLAIGILAFQRRDFV